MPIYNITVHENKIYVALNMAKYWCYKTRVVVKLYDLDQNADRNTSNLVFFYCSTNLQKKS